jgi:hypothetical protein
MLRHQKSEDYLTEWSDGPAIIANVHFVNRLSIAVVFSTKANVAITLSTNATKKISRVLLWVLMAYPGTKRSRSSAQKAGTSRLASFGVNAYLVNCYNHWQDHSVLSC